jgi:hypothetical protein
MIKSMVVQLTLFFRASSALEAPAEFSRLILSAAFLVSLERPFFSPELIPRRLPLVLISAIFAA